MTNVMRFFIFTVICLINGRNCIANNETTVTLTIGSNCTKNDACPKNSECNEEKHICLCNPGYRKSLDSSLCQAQHWMPCSIDANCATIPNAKCRGEMCDCQDDFYPDFSNSSNCLKRPKRVGDPCQRDSHCAEFNAYCNEKVCKCDEFSVGNKKGYCVDTLNGIASVSVRDLYLNRNCSENSDCKGDHVHCSKDGKCFCESPNYPSADKSRCRPPARAGDWCRSDPDCVRFGAICHRHHCKCDDNHITDVNNNCVKGIETKQTCTNDDDCTSHNTKCTKNGKCYCSHGMKPTADGFARRALSKNIGVPCINTFDCITFSSPNSHCADDLTCQCDNSYVVNETTGQCFNPNY